MRERRNLTIPDRPVAATIRVGWTTGQVAEHIGRSGQYVEMAIRRGVLQAGRFGRVYRVHLSHLITFCQANGFPAPPPLVPIAPPLRPPIAVGTWHPAVPISEHAARKRSAWLERAVPILRAEYPEERFVFEYPKVDDGTRILIADIGVFSTTGGPELVADDLLAIVEVGELSCHDKLERWERAVPTARVIWLPKLDLQPDHRRFRLSRCLEV